MKKIYSIILTISIFLGIMSVGSVKAEEGEVCKQETHWYYFSLADHAELAAIEGKAVDTTYSTTFDNSKWPEGAKIESVTTYKGFTKEDIAMWYDLYVVLRTPVYTDDSGEFHHVHDLLYNNHNTNTSNTNNVDDSTRLNYDVLTTDEQRTEFRNSYIEKVYNGQIIPTEAEVNLTQNADGVINGEIHRIYGGTSLAGVVPYNYVVDPANPGVTNDVLLITAKTKVVLSYDCEVPTEPETPEEPKVDEPQVEEPKIEEPLVEEPNPNTGDLGAVLSSVMALSASGTGIYAYRKRKNIK